MYNSNYKLIIWDIANTLQYPNLKRHNNPYKQWGFDPDLIEWIVQHQEIKHAIISNYTQDIVNSLIYGAKIEQYFAYISGITKHKSRKPDIIQYEMMSKDLKSITKNKQLMVGDLPTDMEFADRLGIHGIIVHTDLPPTHHSTQASFKDTKDIISWLNNHIIHKTGS